MRNTIFGRRGLSLALAAFLVAGIPGTRSTWAVATGNTRELLSSELPPGVTLRTATTDQTAAAVRAAIKAQPDLAMDIVRVAVMAKVVHRGDFKDSKDRGSDDCPALRRIVRSAIAADPDRASDITQMALSLCPDCADSLNAVSDPNDPANDPNSLDFYNSPQDLYGGFGVGFGPGFPGSPGFTGSPPSGAVALPSGTPSAVTTVVGG